MSETLNLILTHQPPKAVERMLKYWAQAVPPESIHVIYGGESGDFQSLECERKVFIDSPRLRTVDHQRERQSYIALFRAVLDLPAFRQAHYVHLAEYDQIPLLRGVNDLQRAWLEAEEADLIAYYLQRIDRTNSAHFLMHWCDPWFQQFLQNISVRDNWKAVYALKGYGTFWRREAWEAVAAVREPGPIYLEQWMPTVAHHLGFRIRPIPHDAERQVVPPVELPEPASTDREAIQTQWFVHPVTNLWVQNGK
ncbi:MAG: hypothetical protein AAGK14_11410 [Verrucomicrobiota bacterium]